HVAGDDFAAGAVQDRAAAGAWAIENLDDLAIGRRFARIFDGAAGYEGRLAGDDVVDLGGLAVLDSVWRLLALGFRSMHHADADVVLVIDADDADLLIAHGGRCGLLHGRHDFFVGDVGGLAPRLVLLSPGDGTS